MEKKSLEDLLLIQKQEHKESTRYRLSIKLGYCPECGNELINERKENIPKKYFFSKPYKLWDVRVICMNCKFEEKYDYKTW